MTAMSSTHTMQAVEDNLDEILLYHVPNTPLEIRLVPGVFGRLNV